MGSVGGYMPTPFPGMDPYLERPGVWGEIHTDLIVSLQHFLTPLLRPKYRISIGQQTYALPYLAGRFLADPYLSGELPMVEEVIERHLEIRDTETHEVITAIEILSPTNKSGAEGRQQYERKRLNVLASATSLVEIDLLRGGQPLAMRVRGAGPHEPSDYRIVISRSWQRPAADLYLFSVRQLIPSFHIPLRRGEAEPVLPLNQLLHQLYDHGGYDLAIDYSQPPAPPLSADDATCAAQLMQKQL